MFFKYIEIGMAYKLSTPIFMFWKKKVYFLIIAK